MSVPFGERGGWIRGGLDLVSGRFPTFVFGGGVGDLLPVFHFHDEPRADLGRKLGYLAENGYRTVTADDIGAYVRGGRTLPDRSVALCFDDAWASVWTAAAPLLKQHGFRAIVYAIPGRTVDAAFCRPREQSPPLDGPPFMTWPELRALGDEGTADVQSHTFSHAMVFTSRTPVGFIEPGYDTTPLLARPLVDRTETAAGLHAKAAAVPTFASPQDLGAPLYEQRSRMSDAPRVRHPSVVRAACLALVRSEGGTAFFSQSDWRTRLESTVAAYADGVTAESEDEVRDSIEHELDEARSTLNHKLGGAGVKHVCLPWGVSGAQTARALKRLGFVTAIANRLEGVHAVRPGDDPFWLKRLPNRYIYRLPGRGRRWWFFARP